MVLALVAVPARVSTVAYFWGLAGLFPLLTPALVQPFPGFWWFSFFTGHAATVLGAVWLGASGRVAPTLRTVGWMWLLTNLYAAVAAALNLATGANYGFLARKPPQPTLLDRLGPWPWYIGAMEAIALASFLLFALPFLMRRPSKI
jgi:hypothetical integral membrane protein (TIGR02206 family)